MKTLGLVLQREDIKKLSKNPVDLILIAPGVSISEHEVEIETSCPAHNLNRYMPSGSMEAVSRRIAPQIRNFLRAQKNLPVSAISSQNDLYQYHLRSQYYFLVSLEAYLKPLNGNFKLYLHCKPYARYWSPIRPELNLMYSYHRLHAFLATKLVHALGGQIEVHPANFRIKESSEFFFAATLRCLGINFLKHAKLLKKVFLSKVKKTALSTLQQDNYVAIIVRTDSEVISASYLIAELEKKGVPYVIIHDELLASQTTKKRLSSLGLPYISIGTMHGFKGVLHALWNAPRRIKYCAPSFSLCETAADHVLLKSHTVWRTMCRRLLDFSLEQTHFMYELEAMFSVYNFKKLVTFAYVDQWGAVIRSVGVKFNVPTICVQNAGQDPEEYPCLEWSDHYCVDSNWLRDKLISMNYNAQKITATGLPHFVSQSSETLIPWNERYNKKKIILLTQPIYHDYYVLLINALAEKCWQYEMTLVVKLHPRQSSADYAKNIHRLNHNGLIQVYQQENLDSILNSASLAVSVVSVTIMRAIYLGIPIFSLLPIEEQHLSFPYSSHPVVSINPSIENLVESIEDFLSDFEKNYCQFSKNRSDYLSYHADFYPTNDSQFNIGNIVLNTSLSTTKQV